MKENTSEFTWMVVYDKGGVELEKDHLLTRKWADVVPFLNKVSEFWILNEEGARVAGLILQDGVFIIMGVMFRSDVAKFPNKKLLYKKERWMETNSNNSGTNILFGYEAKRGRKKYIQAIAINHDFSFTMLQSW